jgi:hypothetical protein
MQRPVGRLRTFIGRPSGAPQPLRKPGIQEGASQGTKRLSMAPVVPLARKESIAGVGPHRAKVSMPRE